VGTVLPGLDVRTRAVKVPATLMHLQTVRVTLRDSPSVAAVRDLLDAESRLLLVDAGAGVAGCGDAMDLAGDPGRPRNDLWENCVFAESIEAADGEYSLFQAIDQESDVVPENVDAVRALAGAASAAESRQATDAALDVDGTVAPRRVAAEDAGGVD